MSIRVLVLAREQCLDNTYINGWCFFQVWLNIIKYKSLGNVFGSNKDIRTAINGLFVKSASAGE